MISKVVPTKKTFGQLCQYLQKDLRRSEVLAFEGVRGHDFNLMAKDFTVQHELRLGKKMAAFHAILSFPSGERPPDEKTVEIARKYLDELGIRNTQYAMVKHTDTSHLHIHILANMVNNEGQTIRNSFILNRGIAAAEKLTTEYGLQPETGKHLEQMNTESLSNIDAIKYRLYQNIQEALPDCQRLEDLSIKLLQKGISTRYRYDKESGERIGVSFTSEGYAFKGSKVDRAFSIRGLQTTLALQAELKQQEELKQQQELRQQQELKQSQERKPDDERLRIVPRMRHRL